MSLGKREWQTQGTLFTFDSLELSRRAPEWSKGSRETGRKVVNLPEQSRGSQKGENPLLLFFYQLTDILLFKHKNITQARSSLLSSACPSSVCLDSVEWDDLTGCCPQNQGERLCSGLNP